MRHELRNAGRRRDEPGPGTHTSQRGLFRAITLAFALLATATAGSAQTSYTVLTDFGTSDGYTPYGELTVGPDGALYGTTSAGGQHNYGTVFRVDDYGLATTLHSFGAAGDGRNPYGGLEIGPDGAFYGTTFYGGANGLGTVFKITLSGIHTLLHSMDGANGYHPYDGLELGADGKMYGTVQSGGPFGTGGIFRIASNGTYEPLHHFATSPYSEGYQPFAGLVQGTDGLFYGTTSAGGSVGYGTVFKYDAATDTVTVLHNISPSSDGYYPRSALVQASDGAFYGTLQYGGVNSLGTVFKITSTPGTFSVVRALGAYDGTLGYYPDGYYPWAGLTVHSDGQLYGVTTSGGQQHQGTIFKVVPGATPTFSVVKYLNNQTSERFGANPHGELTEGSDGRLYGTTHSGGVANGTVFSVDTAGAAFQVHHYFNVAPANPHSGVIKHSDGRLYGTTYSGGNYGTVYRLESNNSETTMHSFNNADGAYPYAGVTEGPGGWLYGATQSGGPNGTGTVYRVATTGEFEKLHDFGYDSTTGKYPTGYYPYGRLVLHSDGMLYGTTSQGGEYWHGVIYKVNPGTGAVTNVFDLNNSATSSTGYSPYAGLTEGTDGLLYGSTYYGASTGNGTLFAYDPAADSVTVLHNMTAAGGMQPWGPLLQASDGKWYGTALQGGLAGWGTVFRFDAATSTFTRLHSFTYSGSDGAGGRSYSGLIEGADGALYGTSQQGGIAPYLEGSYGTIYRITKSGALITLHTFNSSANYTEGYGPSSPLIEPEPGVFYGTAYYGGTTGRGVVFELLYAPISLSVVSPNGGEKLFSGTPYDITWEISGGVGGINEFDVFLSVNNGAYTPIAECTNVAGTANKCTWTSPGPTGSNLRVKVVATDTAGNTMSDESNAAFSVVAGSATVTVTTPNTALIWGVGSTQRIKWTHNLGLGTTMRIELSRNGGTTYPEVLAASAPNSSATAGSFDWLVSGPTSTTARIRVSWQYSAAAADTSNVNFKIVNTPPLTITTPKATSNFGYGTDQTVSWTTTLGEGDLIDVFYSTDGGATYDPTPLAINVIATLKKVNIVTPTLGSPTTTARIRLVWKNAPGGPVNKDSVNFKIEAPFITVTAPLAGATVPGGSNQTVKWTNNLGLLENVKIELIKGASTILLKPTTKSDGSEAVTIPTGAYTGAQIKVTWLDNLSVSGTVTINIS